MFCPRCKAEYRPGFNRCSDGEVSLVGQLPKGPDTEQENVRIVYTTNYQNDCVSVCKQFSGAAMPFKVFQQNHQVQRDGANFCNRRAPPSSVNKRKVLFARADWAARRNLTNTMAASAISLTRLWLLRRGCRGGCFPRVRAQVLAGDASSRSCSGGASTRIASERRGFLGAAAVLVVRPDKRHLVNLNHARMPSAGTRQVTLLFVCSPSRRLSCDPKLSDQDS